MSYANYLKYINYTVLQLNTIQKILIRIKNKNVKISFHQSKF